MRSLYVSVCLSVLAALSLSLFVFRMISDHVERAYFDPVFETMDVLQLEAATTAFEQSGRPALRGYLATLDRAFGPDHELLDASGVDLMTGKDMHALLPAQPATLSRGFLGSRFVVTHRSANGHYWLVSVGPEQARSVSLSAYYFLAVGTAVFLGWLGAAFIVRPIRAVSSAVIRFGEGDLTARSVLTRRDEVGQLASSFNQMADRLERLLLSERQLLMDISHEIRSPLTRLKLAVKLARTSSEPGLAFDRIETEVDRIAELTAEMVEVTRLEGDPGLLKLEILDLHELVVDVAHDCCSETQTDFSTINVEGGTPVNIVCDRKLMRRAMENVLRNALRFSPEATSVHVSVTSNQIFSSIVVRDYGPGVPADQIDRIFEPFFRVDEARTLDNGGIGLGLSIVKRIIQLHNGAIVALNAQPGLNVVLELPVVPTPSCKL